MYLVENANGYLLLKMLLLYYLLEHAGSCLGCMEGLATSLLMASKEGLGLWDPGFCPSYVNDRRAMVMTTGHYYPYEKQLSIAFSKSSFPEIRG